MLLAFAVPIVIVLFGSLIFNAQKISSDSRASSEIDSQITPLVKQSPCDVAACPDNGWCTNVLGKPICGDKPVAKVLIFNASGGSINGSFQSNTLYKVGLEFNAYGGEKTIIVHCGVNDIQIDPMDPSRTVMCQTGNTPNISVTYKWIEPSYPTAGEPRVLNETITYEQ
ncbi:hypothetical protein COY90_01840 [Candidatus Roizmanbacteria bacterium CG_4_10_14_0_8_um_filter_39_9]|uniref:Uncharacterized protein n=1 Tax=Candidatus Roizmanbacteria bacterium CG_4_10_14_0_8_um_filter_39_9 TaxID=1974829 RepID=A0A2M7QE45_9BACT|nr:MAG: hypothetical protein COY90_01840 [Candidatus Roizmanbacteria bacterium CG_4_10_14_0_8_um_filter_39_9]